MRIRAILAALTLLAACTSQRPRLAVDAPGGVYPTGRVELRGSSARAESVRLRVAAAPADAPDVLGTVHAADGALVFVPRFPLQPGLSYELVSLGDDPLVLEFALSAPAHEPRAIITNVFPTGDVLPSNLLKFYVHFSAPMRRGEAYEHARLLDGQGRPIAGAFLEVEPELWNPERTRLTLLIDPGRIKRGLILHEELGPVLFPDEAYALEVDAAWRDARGAPLVSGWRRTFRTTAADLTCPDADRWQVTPPRTGTRDALLVRFDEPLDHALATRLLAIQEPGGELLDGRAEVDEGEDAWRFVPRDPWSSARHHLVAPGVLEDRAGNSIGRPFEVDTPAAAEPAAARAFVRVPFEPR